ncbi:MAG: RDD family protein [Phycisphaerales bacterium]|nr:RDD family protein [Phycisphaerales bacterium]
MTHVLRLAVLGVLLICVGAISPRSLAQDMRQEQQTTAGGLTVVRRGELPPIVGGHAWMARQERVTSRDLPPVDRTIVLHLPPRTGGPQEQRGVIRFAGGFESVTERIGWWGNRVYFALKPEVTTVDRSGSTPAQPQARPASTRRAILALTALRGVGSSYSYAPGRPEVLPSLEGAGELIGFVGTRVGPAALIRGSELRLWVLSGGSSGGGTWMRSPFAWEMGVGEAPGEGEQVVLLPWRDGVAIAVARAGTGGVAGGGATELRLFIGRVVRAETVSVKGNSGAVTVWPLLEWRVETRPVARALEPDDLRGLRFVEGASPSEDTLLSVRHFGKNQWDVDELRASGPVRLSTLTDVPSDAELLAMASPGEGGAPGNLALVWTVAQPDEGKRAETGAAAGSVAGGGDKYMICEFSALTGREKFAGPAVNPGLMARGQYQMLVIVLLAVMVAVLVFVLRGEPQVVPIAPKGTAFAEPVRRALAALLDYAPSAVLVALAFGRGPMVLLVPERALEGATMDLSAVGLALAVTIIHCTIGEWLFGRSVGKFFLGCRVCSSANGQSTNGQMTQEMPGRIKLWQALVRNVVRWTVPILGAFIIFDPARRHPGDLAARTIVVCDEPEPGE